MQNHRLPKLIDWRIFSRLIALNILREGIKNHAVEKRYKDVSFSFGEAHGLTYLNLFHNTK